MEIEVANKIIAEYMGEKLLSWCYERKWVLKFVKKWNPDAPFLYSESLDALVSVWGKLKQERVELCLEFGQVIVGYGIACAGDGIMTIQQAAAIATAKAIKEIK